MATIAQAIRSAQTNSDPQLRIPETTQPPPLPASMPDAGKKPACPLCNDLGQVREDVPFGHPKFGKLVRCQCRADEDSARLQALSGLSQAELAIRLDDIGTTGRPGTQAMLEACREFIARPAGILTLWGGVGNAKTMALQGIVNALQLRGAVYVTAFDLISYIRSAFNAAREIRDDDAYSRLCRFERVRVLAIDEFDKVRTTDWVLEQLTDLIDKRYRSGIAGEAGTVLAMNADPAGQPEWIYSRLVDGRNRIIRNADRDLRPYLD